MRAEEAEKIARNYLAGEPERRQKEVQEQLSILLDAIKKVASIGKLDEVYHHVYPEVRDELIKLGYKVQVDYPRTTIIWGKK